MKIFRVHLEGSTQYATATIAVEDEKDLGNKLLHIAEEHDSDLDWQFTEGLDITQFEEIKSWEELQQESSCINEEIETKEDWDNVTLKKFVKGEAVNTQKGEGDA